MFALKFVYDLMVFVRSLRYRQLPLNTARDHPGRGGHLSTRLKAPIRFV